MTEGLYSLRVDDNIEIGGDLLLPEFPELHIQCTASKNNIWEDNNGISIVLRVNDKHTVVIHGSDEINQHAVVIGEYEFKGVGVTVVGHETTLNFTVRRFVENSGSASGLYGTETRTYRAGQIFILQFMESGGDGRTWRLSHKGLVLLEEDYLPHCPDTFEDDQRPSCVNSHRFIMKGMVPGQYIIDAENARFWEYDETKRKVGRKTRQYEVIIL